MTKVKIGIGLTLVAALALTGVLLWGQIKKGGEQALTIIQQQVELTDKEKRIEDLARQREAERKIAVEAKNRSLEIRTEIRRVRDEIDRLERENEAVRDWLDDRIPPDIYDVLREPETDTD